MKKTAIRILIKVVASFIFFTVGYWSALGKSKWYIIIPSVFIAFLLIEFYADFKHNKL